ncbi:MAG: hypothetical protein QNK85_00835 [Crocinitomicaceae bacterium]
MRKKTILILGITMSINLLFAQGGNIEIIKDIRIDALVEKQSVIIPPGVNPKIDGFRIQLFFDSEKSKINSAKVKFMSKYNTVDTYITYSAPNFFLKAGDFRTRLEAEKVKSGIKAEFPTSFIIKEKINLPRLEKENTSN